MPKHCPLWNSSPSAQAFGQRYNPSKQAQKISALQQLLIAVQSGHVQAIENKVQHKRHRTNANPSSKPEEVCDGKSPMPSMQTAHLMLKSKMQRTSFTNSMAKRPTELPEPFPAKRPNNGMPASSHGGRQGMITWWSILPHRWPSKSEPGYQPNEQELSIDGVAAKLEQISTINKRVIDTAPIQPTATANCSNWCMRRTRAWSI